MTRLLLTTILASVTFALSPSSAEEPGSPGSDEKPSAPPSRTDGGAGSTSVNLNEVEIRGELEKPNIFFILPKAQREAESKQRRIRFYPDILEPLDKDRFEEEARVLYQHGIPAD